MIDRPVHSVNLGPGQDLPADAVLPAVPGLDLEVSLANMARWGGDKQRYVTALSTVVEADPSLTADPRQFREFAAVAAWRAGVIGMRTVALHAIQHLAPGHAKSLGSLLGLLTDQVGSFASGQREDRFYWPAWRTDYAFLIARVGGFVGFGGPWQSPPRAVELLAPGHWLVTADGSTWNVDVDIFGHAITRTDPSQSQAPSTEKASAALRTRATSYLLDVIREPSA